MHKTKGKLIYKIAAYLMLFAIFSGLVFGIISGVQTYRVQKQFEDSQQNQVISSN